MKRLTSKLMSVAIVILSMKSHADKNNLWQYVKHRAGALRPQIELCCEENKDIFVRDKTRRYICSELDEMGTQPIVTVEISKKTEKWIKEKFSAKPKFYSQKKVLQQQVETRLRQDEMLKAVESLREVVRYGYSQCLLFEIDTAQYDEMAEVYESLMASKVWEKLGSQTNKTVEDAVSFIATKITKMHLMNVKEYDKILLSKRNAYARFAADHPQMAQTVIANQRAKRAEARAAQAEWNANIAAAEAAAAHQRAEAAEMRAAEAEQDARASENSARREKTRALFGIP